jgi:hypothetical protein
VPPQPASTRPVHGESPIISQPNRIYKGGTSGLDSSPMRMRAFERVTLGSRIARLEDAYTQR